MKTKIPNKTERFQLYIKTFVKSGYFEILLKSRGIFILYF